jgi:PAS domain S-box-containing protein
MDSECKTCAQLEALVARLQCELEAARGVNCVSLAAHHKLFEQATEGIVLADPETGEILDCNQAFLDLSGYARGELIGKPQRILHPPEPEYPTFSRTFAQHRGQRRGEVLTTTLVTKDGTFREVEIKANIVEDNGHRVMQAFFRDVTAELRYQHERETTLRLLGLLNDRNNTRELIHSLTDFLQKWTGCEAVGVRLQEGDDYPYYETRGFPAQFVEAERHLCARTPNGSILRDASNVAVLECLCGCILRGHPTPGPPFFTAAGSFWTNHASVLLLQLALVEDLPQIRGRCIREGYESLALIPLRHGGRTLGLLQINDRKPNRFSPELIHFLERMAGQIAVTLAARQTEDALRLSEQLFRDISEAAGEFMWEVDAQGRIAFMSGRVEAVMGYRPDELVGRHPFEFMRETELERIADQAGRHGASPTGFRDFETCVIAKSGRSVWLSSTGVPVRGPDGRLRGFRGATLDVTARKQAEEALRQSELFLKQTQRIARLGGWQANPHTNYLRWTEGVYDIIEEPRDYTPGFAEGGRYYLPEYAPIIIEQLLRCLATGEPFAVECRLRTATGKILWAEVRGLGPVQEGDRSYVMGTLQDITERKQAEETRRQLEMQLLHAQKLESLGVLAGGIAHDFNNLLAGIRAHADLALAAIPAGSPLAERVGEIKTATQRAADLTRQILAYAGKAQFRLEPLSLSEIVADMRKMLEVVVSKKAHLLFDLAADLQATLADASQIRQVLMNLVVNASEALGGGAGRVSIATRMVQVDADRTIDAAFGGTLPQGDYVCLEVVDSGAGIEPAMQQRIFDPFFTTKFTGRGLGLATVQGIIRAHKGAIEVQSEPGRGTIFRVFLPACGSASQPAARAAKPGPRRGSGTVLVVDDEEMVRKTTQMLFALAGFHVLTAADGQEAIDVFAKHHEQIVGVVLDLTMPKMAGDEVFRELTRIDPDVRVILTSGYTEEDMMRRFAGQRVFGFVEKPEPIDGIIAKLQQALGDGT